MNKQIWKTKEEEETEPSILEYVSGEDIKSDKHLIPYDIKVNQAHAKMLAKVGLISEDDCGKILKALDEIPEDFELKLEYEDVHLNIENYLEKTLGEVGKKINTGRSRSSQAKADMNLFMKDKVSEVGKEIEKLQGIMKKLAKKYKDYKMPAYTHLQPAQATTLGFWLESHVSLLNDDLKRFENCLGRVDVNPLGAGAVAGTTLPIDVDFTTKELGFSKKFDNPIASLSSKGENETECLFCLSMLMLHLSKMAFDLQLWATHEFGMITLDGSIRFGSSMLPQKQNPDVLEMIRAKSAEMHSLLVHNLMLLKGLPSGFNMDVVGAKKAVIKGFGIGLKTLKVAQILLEKVVPNKERMKELVETGGCKAVEELNKLVSKGVPFREAHHRVRQKYITANW